MKEIKRFLKEENGMGVVEVILIIIVLIALVVIFRTQLTKIVNEIFKRMTSDVKNV